MTLAARRKFVGRMPARTPGPAPRGPRALRPVLPRRLEHLEDRLVPATFNVGSGAVTGLIAAIHAANANAEDDTINLSPGSVYTLTAVDNVCYRLAAPALPPASA